MNDGPAAFDTVGRALTWGQIQLERAGVEEPGLEAQLLLAHLLGKSRLWVLVETAGILGVVERSLYAALVERRRRREPYAYLVGNRAWRHFSLIVDRNVLIPRPETELLADLAIAAVRTRGASDLTVVDVGTGSGALAIAVAHACPSTRVIGIDCSAGALRTARRNVERWMATRIRLVQGDLLADIAGPVDIIVANLPYIPTAEISHLAPELGYEPPQALDGGPDGLGPIIGLLDQAARRLSPGGAMLLECGHDQAARLVAYVISLRPGATCAVHRDLSGIERFVAVTGGFAE